MVEKYVKDGQVGILYSPGFGAGWSTWGEPDMAYDAALVKAFIEGGVNGLIEATKEKYPDAYTGGAKDIKLAWLTPGTAFRINEYDGNESIECLGQQSFMTA